MRWYYIVAALGVLLLFVTAFFSYKLFVFAFSRTRKEQVNVGGTPWDEFLDEIEQARGWLRAQTSKSVFIESEDGISLHGRLITSENAKNTMLLMHGYRSSDSFFDFSCAAKMYHDMGFNLLFADQRAHGESGGKYICFGVKERFDCLRWVKYINSVFGEEKGVFLDGISMGASTVLMASGLQLPPNVRGIVADCGYTSPWAEFSHIAKTIIKIPKFPVLYVVDIMSRVLAGFGLKDYSTLDALKTNKIPILFAHGQCDNFVPPCMTEENYRACTGEKYIVRSKKGKHGTSYLCDRGEYQKALDDFVQRYSV
ncbi:MAG: alpha/beta hydrolase [Oscillospiraceae bacterium]